MSLTNGRVPLKVKYVSHIIAIYCYEYSQDEGTSASREHCTLLKSLEFEHDTVIIVEV